MAAGKTKYRVLVAGGNEKLCELLSEILPKNEYAFLPPAKTAGEVRRRNRRGSGKNEKSGQVRVSVSKPKSTQNAERLKRASSF